MPEKQYPEPVVGCFILNEKGELLLIKNSKWNNYYTLCGGHVELGETVADACKREAKEETGLDIDFKQVFFVQDAIWPKNYYKKIHFVAIKCLCTIQDGEVGIDKQEAVDFKWINPLKYEDAGVKIEPYTLAIIKYFNEWSKDKDV